MAKAKNHLSREYINLIADMLRWWKNFRNQPPPAPAVTPFAVADDGGTAFLNTASPTIPAYGVVQLGGVFGDGEQTGDHSDDYRLCVAGRFPSVAYLGRLMFVNGSDPVANNQTGRAYSARVQPRWVAYSDTVSGAPPKPGECWGPGVGYTLSAGYKVSVGLPGFRAMGPVDTEKKIALMIAEESGPWWAKATAEPERELDGGGNEICRKITAAPCAQSDGEGLHDGSAGAGTNLSFTAYFPRETIIRSGETFLYTAQARIATGPANPVAPFAINARPFAQVALAQLDDDLTGGGGETTAGGGELAVKDWRINSGFQLDGGTTVLLVRGHDYTGANWWDEKWKVAAAEYAGAMTAVIDLMADVNGTDPKDDDLLTTKREILVEIAKTAEEPQIIWTHEQYEPPP